VSKGILLRLLSMTGLDWFVIRLLARKYKVNWIERFWFITKKVTGLRITYPVLPIKHRKLSPQIIYEEMEKLGRQVSLESERVAENMDRVRKSMFPILDKEFVREGEKITEGTVVSPVETLTEKPTMIVEIKDRWISLRELKDGPDCLSKFIPDWYKHNWVILFNIPRSALPSGIIVKLLDKWTGRRTVNNIEKLGKGKSVISGSVIVCTRSDYPSRYVKPIRPSATGKYVDLLIKMLNNANPETIKIIITTKEIYRLKKVKESFDSCGFKDVKVTTAEEEKSAWEKLYEKSRSVLTADRFSKAAVFLPELITYCSEDGLDLDSIKKLLDEEVEKEIIEESDAKILYQVISEGATELKPEFKEYKPVAISLGILKEIEKGKEEE
jgi:hypothetical protein